MSPGYSMFAVLGWVLLALGSALLASDRERRLAAAGMLCLGLGLSAWRATPPDGAGGLATPARLGEGFLVVNGGLLVLGLGVVLGAAVSRASRRRPHAILAIGLGTLLIARTSLEFLLAAGVARTTGSAVALGLLGAGLVVVGRGAGSAAPAREVSPRRSWGPMAVPMAVAMMAVGTATAFGPHVAIVFVGVIAAAWSGYFLLRQAPRPYPAAPVLTLLLVPTYWLLATIAGPEGLWIEALQRVPLSPAAEWLTAPALLLVGWSVAGLWPLHRWTPGALLAPLGALLLVRIGFPLVPGGIDDWRPVAIPLLILGTWHAVWSARWASAAAGAGLLGLAGHTPVGAAGAVWLLGSAFLLELCSSAPVPARLWEVVRVASWAASAWGGLLVLEGGLRSEVVYTAVGALGLAVVIVARRGQAMIARAPSTPAPSV